METLNLQNVHPEVRAYIYQQLADIENFLPEGSNISILVNEKSGIHSSTIKVTTPYGDIVGFDEKKDIFESLAAAKQNLVKQIDVFAREYAAEEDVASEADTVTEALPSKRPLH